MEKELVTNILLFVLNKRNYGIAVGKKVGNAVTRNKVKRQVRNIITNNVTMFPNYHNYIIICKRDVLTISYKEMEENLIKLLNNIGE